MNLGHLLHRPDRTEMEERLSQKAILFWFVAILFWIGGAFAFGAAKSAFQEIVGSNLWIVAAVLSSRAAALPKIALRRKMGEREKYLQMREEAKARKMTNEQMDEHG